MHELLRSVWDEPRPPHPPPRVWRDWALVGLFVPLAVLEGVLRPDLPWRVLSVLVVAALVPVLLWRRTHPLLMVTIAFGTVTVLPVETYTMAFLLLLPYALFRWGSGRAVVLGAAVLVGRVCVSMVLGHLAPADVFGGFSVLLAACALGAALRYRTRARIREFDQVKLLERERLARDLHDTVAHHVSAMAIRAQAGLATMAVRPDAAADALRVIDSEASHALAEMRALVRVLRRNEPAELAPSPGIGDLGQLTGNSRTGPDVDLELVGDFYDLSPLVGTVIYRLAQESVTNALRHARHATRIEVRVAADDTSVHLRVRDDGDPSPVRPYPSRGFGLLGMVERADLLGGSCEAGPDPGRGWTVTAVLPRAGAVA